jgi:hypothetical protein
MSGGVAALAPAALIPATTASGKNAEDSGGGGGPHGLATAGRRPTVPTGGAQLRRWWQKAVVAEPHGFAITVHRPAPPVS